MSNEAEKAVLLLPLRLIFHETPTLPPAPIINGLTLAARSVKGGLSLQAVEGDRGVGTNGQITLEELDGAESEAVFRGGGNHNQPVS